MEKASIANSKSVQRRLAPVKVTIGLLYRELDAAKGDRAVAIDRSLQADSPRSQAGQSSPDVVVLQPPLGGIADRGRARGADRGNDRAVHRRPATLGRRVRLGCRLLRVALSLDARLVPRVRA